MNLDNFNQIVGKGINIYGSRERIRSQLIDNAKQYLDLQDVDFYKTSVISYIIDSLSILSANHLFYDSVIYREFFMIDAQLQESVYNLAKWIGYEVPKATPSKVDLLFTIPLSFRSNEVRFTIPNTFTAKGNNIVFTIDSVSQNIAAVDFNFNKELFQTEFGDDFPAATGRIINSSVISVRDSDGYFRPVFVSADGKNASFTLPFTQHQRTVTQFYIPENIQPYQFYSKILEYKGMISSVKVWVVEPQPGDKIALDTTASDEFNPGIPIKGKNGPLYEWILWAESPGGIYTMGSNNEEYVFVSGINKGEIFFGNGVVGKQPARNSIVTIELFITQGEEGHVIPNTITSGDKLNYSVTPVYDDEGNITSSDLTSKLHTIAYSIMNPAHSAGGSNTPTLPQIKRNAIINLRAKERLVSEMDYDDINVIMGDAFPTVEAFPILKRSDIKVNEIMAFIRLDYHDEFYLPQIVPTRNAKFPLYDPEFDAEGKYTILRTSEVTIDGEDYQTLYNITMDSSTMTAGYDYIIKNIFGSPAVLYDEAEPSWYRQYSFIPINGIDIDVEISDDPVDSSSSTSSSVIPGNAIYPLTFKVNVNHLPTSPDSDYKVDAFRCRMITKWDDNQEYEQTFVKTHLDSEGETVYEYFEFEIPNYLSVPSEVQRFEYFIDGYVLLRNSKGQFINEDGEVVPAASAVLGWQNISSYYIDVIVRKDLSDVMLSTLTKTAYWGGIVHPNSYRWDIHNVPVILSSYLDDGSNGGVLNRADNLQYPNFEVTVMQAMMKNIDLGGKRMLTDFINIKFPDTYGTLNNLIYNDLDYTVESRFRTPFNWEQPSGITFKDNDLVSSSSAGVSPSGITRYIVNGEVPNYEAAGRDLASYIDYIAEWYPTAGTGGGGIWYLIPPKRGMYVKVEDELDSQDREKIIVYDGDNWKDVQEFQIPLQIKLKVEMDPRVSMSSNALKDNIKRSLINHFSSKMGIQKEIDRSEIVTVVRETAGVKYCELTEPEIDIRFDYDIRDLEQEDLIDYTPQYIGFTNDTIDIDITL